VTSRESNYIRRFQCLWPQHVIYWDTRGIRQNVPSIPYRSVKTAYVILILSSDKRATVFASPPLTSHRSKAKTNDDGACSVLKYPGDVTMWCPRRDYVIKTLCPSLNPASYTFVTCASSLFLYASCRSELSALCRHLSAFHSHTVTWGDKITARPLFSLPFRNLLELMGAPLWLFINMAGLQNDSSNHYHYPLCTHGGSKPEVTKHCIRFKSTLSYFVWGVPGSESMWGLAWSNRKLKIRDGGLES